MIYFEVKGTGEPLVFIHGFMENRKIWNDYVSLFSATHQIITIDLAGHGNSKNFRSTNTMDDFVDDVIEVLNHLKISNATFIGHSMGGYVILALCEVYSQFVNKVVLINSTSLPDNAEKKEQRLKIIPTIERNFPLFIKLSIPMLFSDALKPQLQNEINQLKEIASETSIEGIEAAIFGMRNRPDRTSVFYDSNFPFLIINGKFDQTIDVDLFNTIIPLKENIIIENLACGHVAFWEQKEKVVQLLTNFIDSFDF